MPFYQVFQPNFCDFPIRATCPIYLILQATINQNISHIIKSPSRFLTHSLTYPTAVTEVLHIILNRNTKSEVALHRSYNKKFGLGCDLPWPNLGRVCRHTYSTCPAAPSPLCLPSVVSSALRLGTVSIFVCPLTPQLLFPDLQQTQYAHSRYNLHVRRGSHRWLRYFYFHDPRWRTHRKIGCWNPIYLPAAAAATNSHNIWFTYFSIFTQYLPHEYCGGSWQKQLRTYSVDDK